MAALSVLNYVMRKRRPNINAGDQLPLNLALQRGNLMIVDTLLELGQINPTRKDSNGKGYIHIATAVLAVEHFDTLIEKGVDPMLPDSQGNTVLHLLAKGDIKDAEYDFFKQSVQKHKMRLSRNQDGKTALGILKAFGQPARGQPNYKKRLAEFLDEIVARDSDF